MSNVCLTHYEMLENHIAKLEAELAAMTENRDWWRTRAEERGDEIKRLYTEASKEVTK